MLGAEFTSCWLKLERAEEHANTLKTELFAWANSNPYVISRKVSSDGSRHSIVLDEIKVFPRLDNWSVLFGDFVHNLRSALDHFIYACAIYQTGAKPPAGHKILQFPICDDSIKFGNQAKRLASLTSRMRSAIEQVQPYNRKHPTHPPLLALIREFDDSDKHRLLTLVLSQVAGGEFNFTLPPGAGVPIVSFASTPLERGMEISWFTIDPPQFDVDYKHSASIVVTIGHFPGPSGHGRTEVPVMLDYLKIEVRRLITLLAHHLA